MRSALRPDKNGDEEAVGAGYVRALKESRGLLQEVAL